MDHNEQQTCTTSSQKQQNTNFWTLNEQRQLEELLNEFPPEAVESQRFIKIAKAMGNRTPKQIASRVQKFFKKLHEANLPIPGSSSNKSLRNRNKSHKPNFKLERPSTFFPERNVPNDLLMKDELEDELQLSSTRLSNAAESESTVKMLKLLNHVRDVKSNLWSKNSSSGFNCSICKEDLVNKSRLKCDDCQLEINFCPDCLTHQLVNKTFSHLEHSLNVL